MIKKHKKQRLNKILAKYKKYKQEDQIKQLAEKVSKLEWEQKELKIFYNNHFIRIYSYLIKTWEVFISFKSKKNKQRFDYLRFICLWLFNTFVLLVTAAFFIDIFK